MMPWEDPVFCNKLIEFVQFCTHGRRCWKCCHLWTGKHIRRYGYVHIPQGYDIRPGAYGMHRFRYQMIYGTIPKVSENKMDSVVCHTCDEPRCVNIHHLFVGTQRDNIYDMLRKQRHAPQYGSYNGNSRLREEDVRAIYTLHKRGISAKVIAHLFSITGEHTRLILRGIKWPALYKQSLHVDN